MIEGVIFDWAGTTVDYGCFAPVQAFIEAFAHFNIMVTTEETRKPMGMLKIEHIRTMLKMDRIAAAWKKEYGRPADAKDVQAIYEQFEPKLMAILKNFATPKPYVVETVEQLRAIGLKIGSTTGYTDSMMALVVPEAASQGYAPDIWITPDSTSGKGRPYPYMIFENMRKLQLTAVKNVMKVGDTVSDIKEGVCAGVLTVGVIEGSSELGLSEAEFNRLSETEKQTRCSAVERTFRNAGADYVIKNFAALPDLILAVGIRGC